MKVKTRIEITPFRHSLPSAEADPLVNIPGSFESNYCQLPSMRDFPIE
ncbi:MAG: hypothetical protein KGM98_14275 [Bacteroidota bacterium]|nr:hypothetical protein [Bacteroidota bacterium]